MKTHRFTKQWETPASAKELISFGQSRVSIQGSHTQGLEKVLCSRRERTVFDNVGLIVTITLPPLLWDSLACHVVLA